MQTPYNNETQQPVYAQNPNLYLQTQGQPVPVAYQAPPAVMTPQPNVVIIEEGGKPTDKSQNCCYCKAPRQSACGCLDPGKYYCCFLIVGNYVLLGLKYLLTCLCIIRLCQGIC